jgi:hypothetical protein
MEMAAEVYDRASAADIGQALSLVGKQLLQNVLQNDSVQWCSEQPPKSIKRMGVGERGWNRTFNLLIKSRRIRNRRAPHFCTERINDLPINGTAHLWQSSAAYGFQPFD